MSCRLLTHPSRQLRSRLIYNVRQNPMTDSELIGHAKSAAINFAPSESCSVCSVGSAILTPDGQVFTGLCIDLPCGMGFCAEHAAAAEMLKHGKSRIACVVAVSAHGVILPPCGRCREFMIQIDRGNRAAEVIVGIRGRVTLGSLLPMDYQNEPNQPPEPTPTAVTPAASAPVAPAVGAAHL